MKTFLIIIFTFALGACYSQLTEAETSQKRKDHRAELIGDQGILNKEEINEFQGLDYFDFDSSYQIEATFVKDKGPKFEMMTSTDRKPIYRKVGVLKFEINGTQNELTVYQNVELSKSKEYKNYLFIPFRDGTSGNESYGGGRYLDLEKQKGKLWKIDFNLAYNPYCAYSYRYSCPIPPKENTLSISIKAGEKVPHGH